MSDETDVGRCEDFRERLSAYDAHELDEAGAAAVAKHLADCDACSGLLDSLRRTTALAGRLADEPPPRSMSLRVLAALDEATSPDLSNAPEILTVEELARFLRIPTSSLEEELGSIPAFEIGGELRFRRDRVLDWIEEREEARFRQQEFARLRAV